MAENKCTLSPDDIKRVKGMGFLQCVGTDNFNAHVITRNGKITVSEMKKIADAAEKFGNGEIAFTTRLNCEVQAIPYEKIDDFIAFLAEEGLEVGGTGPKVRPIVSCKGTTCQYGLCDTYGLSRKVHDMFFKGYGNVKLSHKFKIAVGGCPNNCVKPDLNDVGISGRRVPVFNAEACKGCKKCFIEEACPVHVPKVVDGKAVIDESLCNKCGRCVGKCPFGAVTDGEYGYALYLGGRWGKRVARGIVVNKIFTSEEEVLSAVEKAILFYKENGAPGERFADTISRIGFENVEKEILSDEILGRKEEILAK